MQTHVEAHLPEHALGLLDGEVLAEVETHLANCRICGAWLSELREAVQPAASLGRIRLIRRSLEGHFEEFRGALVELFAIDYAQVDRLLHRISSGTWHAGPDEGVEFQAVRVGDRLGESVGVVVRAAPGAMLSMHGHGGDELTLVLQGGFSEDDGHQLWRGQLLHKPPGSEHSLTALPGPTCICAVLTRFE